MSYAHPCANLMHVPHKRKTCFLLCERNAADFTVILIGLLLLEYRFRIMSVRELEALDSYIVRIILYHI